MRVLAIILIGLLAIGCQTEPNTHVVENQSAETVVIYWDDGFGAQEVIERMPGKTTRLSLFHTDECSTGVLYARDLSGKEVARRTDPLCPQDTWVIR